VLIQPHRWQGREGTSTSGAGSGSPTGAVAARTEPSPGRSIATAVPAAAITANPPTTAIVTSAGPPAVTVRRVTGARGVWIAEADIDYGDGDRWQTVVIFELDEHGLIARETRYYPRASSPRPGARNWWRQ
jgi:hypothetical protein